jgi:DNA-binding transcriptional regulator LsrR (DeoR family)
MVRQEYLALDVALFGCGDGSDDGWIEWTRKIAREGFDPSPPTDVCLNPISERGEPIPLPEHDGHRREHLCVSIDHIRSLTPKKDKLALLLASGASKGVPITLVVRAGGASAVVCDQAAARAAADYPR